MKFELEGYNIDNLIKTLHIKKVKIFNLEKPDDCHVSFFVQDKDERKARRYIHNFKINKTKSLVKQLPKLFLKNIGVVIGVFLGLIFSIFSSVYTWQIQVFGNAEISTQEILDVLATNGVNQGKINLQTNEEIENILLNNYDRIAQVSVIKRGTAIIINLSEKLVYNEQEFKPIVAKYCGIITNINIIKGTPNVKVGEYVNAGDPLVLPFNLNSEGKKVSVQPVAEINAEIYIVERCELNSTEQVMVRTGETTVEYRYKLFNFDLFSGKNKNSFANFEFDVYNENISDILPLKREVYVYHELKLDTIMHNLEQEKDNLIEKSKQQAYSSLPMGEIINEESSCVIMADKLYASTILTIIGIIND